jgi:hypothetical protein
MDVGFGTGVPGLSTTQLTAFAQFLLVGVEIIAPVLFTWNVWDATMERMRGRMDPLHEEFDFIVGQ